MKALVSKSFAVFCVCVRLRLLQSINQCLEFEHKVVYTSGLDANCETANVLSHPCQLRGKRQVSSS